MTIDLKVLHSFLAFSIVSKSKANNTASCWVLAISIFATHLLALIYNNNYLLVINI